MNILCLKPWLNRKDPQKYIWKYLCQTQPERMKILIMKISYFSILLNKIRQSASHDSSQNIDRYWR